MTNIAIVMMLSLIFSVLVGIVLIPFLKKIKVGQRLSEYLEDAHRNKQGTPTMGGIGFVLSSVITFFTVNLFNEINYDVIGVLLAYIGFFLIGFIDDYLKVKIKTYDGLKAGIRILLETLLALYLIVILKEGGFSLERLYLPIVKGFVNTSYLFLPFFLIVLIGSANAINLSDGLDGLASGLSMIALTPFILISLNNGNYQLTLLLVSIIGSLIGFLFFNFHPAKIFMGDCGSLALGDC